MTDLTLLGDIGGTNSRFALVNKGRTDYRHERHYENAGFPTFQDAIESYIAEIGERPTAGVVALLAEGSAAALCRKIMLRGLYIK